MIMRRTACAALAMRSVSAASFLPTTPTTRNPLWVRRGGCLRLSSSSFQPATPPGTHGTPVFPNIDFTVSQSSASEAFRRNNDTQAVFVVTGANRGIGLQFVKSIMERTKGKLVACCRSPENATELHKYIASRNDDDDNDSSRIQMVQLDLESQASIEAAGQQIRDQYDRLDLLLNVAGILGDAKTTRGPERALVKIDRNWLEKTMAVNLIGPVMFTKEMTPLMIQQPRRRQNKNDKDGENHGIRPTAVIANLSARVGSIADNGLGGWYSYRMSKSALNQFTKSSALELRRNAVWCVSLHPGTTDTDLSKPFQSNVKPESLFPVEFTVSQLLNVIDSLTEEQSGGFYDWAGQSLSF